VNLWRDLVSDNPMLIEIRRFMRKLLAGKGGNLAIVVVILVIYSFIFLLVAEYSKDFDPVILVWIQTGLFMLLLPVMSAGIIAGERERRTWEILLTAPVTKAQIVVGKYLAVSAGASLTILAFALLILPCQVSNRFASIGSTASAELMSITFAMMLMGLSLYVSSRSRTTFAAIGTCIGIVFVAYVAIPLFISAASERSESTVLELIDPFYALPKLIGGSEAGKDYSRWSVSLSQAAVYLVLTALMLVGATLTVRRMDEVRDLISEPKARRGKAHA